MYSTGKYDSDIKFGQFKQQKAQAGLAATIQERNKRGYEEINVKPITQNKPDLSNYNPKHYLKPFNDDKLTTIDYNTSITREDLAGNSIAFNRILNKKRAAEEIKQRGSIEGISLAKQIDRDSFLQTKNRKASSHASSTIDALRLSNNGRQICEKIMQVSKDEHEYFQDKKVMTNDQSNGFNYKRQIPDYFRVLDNPKNQKNLEDSAVDGMVSIISKNQGWITVTPRSLNRKNPVEKLSSQGGDVTKTSILTPSWMKLDYSNTPQSDPLKSMVTKGAAVRQENNRTILVDKDQPQKSVFSIGGFRHNVATKEQTDLYKPTILQPTRFIEWKEQPKNQRYDMKISTKIGSFHEQQSSPYFNRQ
eukprot:403357067